MKELSLSLFGPCPPPYGGVSIHVERLSNRLTERNIIHTVYDIQRGSSTSKDELNNSKCASFLSVVKYLLNSNDKIVHVHYSNIFCVFLLSLLSFRNVYTIITIHGSFSAIYLNSRSNIIKKLSLQILKQYSRIIVVNENIYDQISEYCNPKSISVIPAYIPPIVNSDDLKTIEELIGEFVQNHTPILSTNAYKLVFNNNQDLYGIDMCIELCYLLSRDYPEIGMIISIGSIGNYEYFQELVSRVDKLGIDKNIRFVIGEKYYPILLKSNIYLRPTNTDGDSLSIREAISFEIPVVTSDVVHRPDGCHIFKTRDMNDFTIVTRSVLSQKKENSIAISSYPYEFVDKIIDIYLGACVQSKNRIVV